MTHTIDAGIGVFTANCEGNLKLKMFLDSLKDKIELDGKLDEIINFIDNGCINIDVLKNDISNLELDLNNKEELIDQLKGDLSELQDADTVDYEIETGVGVLGYSTDNLQVLSMMEDLEEALRKSSPLKVSELLQSI